jgi:aminoglycoside phosphotransferase
LRSIRDRLLRVADSGRQNGHVSLAQLGLAEVYRDLKDEAAAVRWLKRAAEAPTVPTNRSLMGTSDLSLREGEDTP